MVSVFDLPTLSPNARRMHDLEVLVCHRRMIGYHTADDLHQILTERGFDYTLDEINTALSKENISG